MKIKILKYILYINLLASVVFPIWYVVGGLYFGYGFSELYYMMFPLLWIILSLIFVWKFNIFYDIPIIMYVILTIYYTWFYFFVTGQVIY